MIKTEDGKFLLDMVRRGGYGEGDREYALFDGLEEGIGVWQEQEQNSYLLVRVMRPEDAVRASLRLVGGQAMDLRANELVRPDYDGKTGVSDSDAVALWDAGIQMTMPGGRDDIYLWADRATIEMVVGKLADAALHPEQEEEGADEGCALVSR